VKLWRTASPPWSEAIRTGLATMVEQGVLLRPGLDACRLALALLAAVQGGLLLAQAHGHTEALDAMIAHLASQAR
jgi:TetR/AcrR family transcriptional repressor of nem operon